LQALMAIDVIKIDRPSVIAASVRDYAGGTGQVGIADYLIARFSFQAGCEKCMTFDKNAAKSAGMTLIK
jgi:predicted nucleic-acid-binding protein